MQSTVTETSSRPLILSSNRVVDVQNLSVRFTTSERTVDAVRDLSFHVDRGETLAIVGESGSGKSVTSLALMRLIEHGGGRILNGKMLFRQRRGDRFALHGSKLRLQRNRFEVNGVQFDLILSAKSFQQRRQGTQRIRSVRPRLTGRSIEQDHDVPCRGGGVRQ